MAGPPPLQAVVASGSAGQALGADRPLLDRSRGSGEPRQLSPCDRVLGYLEHAARAHATGLRETPEVLQDALQEAQMVVRVDAYVVRVPPQMIGRAVSRRVR